MLTAETDTTLFNGYQPIKGIHDEFFVASGQPREHCRHLISLLESIGADELARRWKLAQKTVRDNGVTYNAFDESGEESRPWQLDAAPTVLSREDFTGLEAGIKQRATLLNLLLDDLFGEQRLIREKVIPPQLLFGHPGFYRAYHDLPAERSRLTLYALDLARDPQGDWWVTSDRTRAPDGLGFVLENRIVTSRMLPAAFRKCRVQRLASFFVQLSETRYESATRFQENPRIVVLSRGSEASTYFEDVYLAKYLGYALVEGGDLAVRDGRLMLKTLGGLLPVEVILRRVTDDECDPVELDGSSLSGVSGLVEVARSGNVAVANGLGSRLAESLAFFPFLPAICRFLLGEELMIPSSATWWCGQPKVLSHVLDHLDDMVIRPAWRTHNMLPAEASLMTSNARAELVAALRARPGDYVAQERIVRSTVPVWFNSRFEPWHTALRMFAVAKGDSYDVLPGGLARVSADRLSLDRSMSAGERTQDVWVPSDGPVEAVSLLHPPGESITLKRGGNDLPSRDADNLFWLGRNIERADGTARVLRVTLQRIVSETDVTAIDDLPALLRALAALGQIEPGFVLDGLQTSLPEVDRAIPESVFSDEEPRGLRTTVSQIVRLGDVIRDRLSTLPWQSLHRLGTLLDPPRHGHQPDAADVLDILDQIILGIATFGGLASDGMTRSQVWRFLELGRRIERAWHMSSLLHATLVEVTDPEDAVLESLLEAGDSIMTYRMRYLATLRPEAVIDLLLCDDTNPRSIVTQLASLENHICRLPSAGQALLGNDERLAMSLHNAVRLADPYELANADGETRRTLDRLLQRVIDQLPRLSDAITNRYLIHAGLPRQFTSSS